LNTSLQSKNILGNLALNLLQLQFQWKNQNTGIDKKLYKTDGGTFCVIPVEASCMSAVVATLLALV
jgi:hypothetical protein